MRDRWKVSRAAIIIGPPWPRSSAVRVIQSQIQYYHERGFLTVFIGVPWVWYFKRLPPVSRELPPEISELGADRVFAARFDVNKYKSVKFQASNQRAFVGSALDWQVALARAVQLSRDEVDSLRRIGRPLFHVNHLYTLGFALDLRRKLFGRGFRVPIILETHDIQSHLTYQKRDCNPRTGRPDSLKKLVKSEIALLKKADVLIHLSLHDFQFFKKLLTSRAQFLAFPSIDEKFRCAVKTARASIETIDLLFVGQWHQANLDGLRWFLKHVWPLIVHQNYSFKVVGVVGQMVKWKLPRLYAAFQSCFVGEVPDVAPYYRAAHCVIGPMRWGTGISIKTVEALALGKPFVGTSAAFRGMPMDRLEAAGIRPHDEPWSFARAIVEVLPAERKAASISRAAYDDIFSFRASCSARDSALRAANVSTPL